MAKQAHPKPATEMQIAFARSYVRCMNASQAAKEAGYKHPYKMGNQLIHKPAIIAEIDRLRAKIERQIIKPGEVIQQTVNIMRGNIADVMDWGFTEIEVPKPDGSMAVIPQPWVKAIPRDQLPKEVTDAIAEVSLTDKGAFKIKMHDKGAAIDKLMRHLGLYEADNKQTTDALTELIQAVQGTKMPVKRASDVSHAAEEASEADE